MKLSRLKQKRAVPVRSSKLVGLLACGCERTGTLAVRNYTDGRIEWGYACKCGKAFQAHGTLRKAN